MKELDGSGNFEIKLYLTRRDRMLKRVMATACLLVALPVLANAWTVNSWVKSNGGTITINGGTAQTQLNGSVFKN